MAFKMKAGKEGPMKKNFPSVFKKDKLTELAKQGQPKGTKEALETSKKVGGNKRRRKNTYNTMMDQSDKVQPSRAVKLAKKVSPAFKKETKYQPEVKYYKKKMRQEEVDKAFSSNYQKDPAVKRNQRLKEIELMRKNLKKGK